MKKRLHKVKENLTNYFGPVSSLNFYFLQLTDWWRAHAAAPPSPNLGCILCFWVWVLCF